MGWARFDDQRATNRKVMAVGLEARGLDEAAICWSAGNLTDGHISEQVVAMIATGHGCTSWRKVVARLVKENRWEPDPATHGGWWIHDYLAYNPSRDQVLAEREAARKRMARTRGSSPEQPPERSPMRSPEQNGAQPPEPTPEQPANERRTNAARSSRSARASRPVPSRPYPTVTEVPESSSSNLVRSPELDDDDDPDTRITSGEEATGSEPDYPELSVWEQTGAIAIDRLARADLERREAEKGPVGNEMGWLNAARKVRVDRHAAVLRSVDLRAYIGRVPELVKLLEPDPPAPAKDPLADDLAALARRMQLESADARRDRPCGTCEETTWVTVRGDDGVERMHRCPTCAGVGVAP